MLVYKIPVQSGKARSTSYLTNCEYSNFELTSWEHAAKRIQMSKFCLSQSLRSTPTYCWQTNLLENQLTLYEKLIQI